MSAAPDSMRILVAAPWEPWPLDHGGRLRLYHIMRELSRANALTLAIPSDQQHRAQMMPLAEVVTMGRASEAGVRLGTNSTHRPAKRLATRMAGRHFGRDDRIAGWLHRHATSQRFDVALCFGPNLGQYVEDIRVPVVWDVVDDLVLYTLRAAQCAGMRCWPSAARSALLYALFERSAAKRAAATVFASDVDLDSAARWTGAARVEVVTNGVDLDYFHDPGHGYDPGTVVFVGALDFPPNVDAVMHFATNIWPSIYAGDTRRQLIIVGRRPDRSVRALSSRAGVRIIGDVDDVRPHLARAAVVVVPTRGGGGVKNKILEACAMRRPVVASRRALGGLSARAGIDVISAMRKAEWISAVSSLLENADLADAIAASGHEWVSRAHRWVDIAAGMGEILRSVCLRRPLAENERETVCL